MAAMAAVLVVIKFSHGEQRAGAREWCGVASVARAGGSLVRRGCIHASHVEVGMARNLPALARDVGQELVARD